MKTNRQVTFFYLAKLCMNVGDVLAVVLIVDGLALFDECRIYPYELIDGVAMIALAYIISFVFNSCALKQDRK